jgi:hypothetical protein
MAADREVRYLITADGSQAVAAFNQVKGAITEMNTVTGGIAGKLGAALGGLFGLDKLKEFYDLGVKAMAVEQSFGQATRSMGLDSRELVEDMKKATAGLMDETDIMQKGTKALVAGLSADKLKGIGEMARLIARRDTTDIGEAYDRLVDTFVSGRSRALGQMGILNKELAGLADEATNLGIKGFSVYEMAMEATRLQMLKMDMVSNQALENQKRWKVHLHELAEAFGKKLYEGIMLTVWGMSKLAEKFLGFMALAEKGVNRGFNMFGMQGGTFWQDMLKEQESASKYVWQMGTGAGDTVNKAIKPAYVSEIQQAEERQKAQIANLKAQIEAAKGTSAHAAEIQRLDAVQNQYLDTVARLNPELQSEAAAERQLSQLTAKTLIDIDAAATIGEREKAMRQAKIIDEYNIGLAYIKEAEELKKLRQETEDYRDSLTRSNEGAKAFMELLDRMAGSEDKYARMQKEGYEAAEKASRTWAEIFDNYEKVDEAIEKIRTQDINKLAVEMAESTHKWRLEQIELTKSLGDEGSLQALKKNLDATREYQGYLDNLFKTLDYEDMSYEGWLQLEKMWEDQGTAVLKLTRQIEELQNKINQTNFSDLGSIFSGLGKGSIGNIFSNLGGLLFQSGTSPLQKLNFGTGIMTNIGSLFGEKPGGTFSNLLGAGAAGLGGYLASGSIISGLDAIGGSLGLGLVSGPVAAALPFLIPLIAAAPFIAGLFKKKPKVPQLQMGYSPSGEFPDMKYGGTYATGEGYYFATGGGVGGWTDKMKDDVTSALKDMHDKTKAEFESLGLDVSGFTKDFHSEVVDLAGLSQEEIQQKLADITNAAIQSWSGLTQDVLDKVFAADALRKSLTKTIEDSIKGYQFNMMSLTEKAGDIYTQITDWYTELKASTSTEDIQTLSQNILQGIDQEVQIVSALRQIADSLEQLIGQTLESFSMDVMTREQRLGYLSGRVTTLQGEYSATTDIEARARIGNEIVDYMKQGWSQLTDEEKKATLPWIESVLKPIQGDMQDVVSTADDVMRDKLVPALTSLKDTIDTNLVTAIRNLTTAVSTPIPVNVTVAVATTSGDKAASDLWVIHEAPYATIAV